MTRFNPDQIAAEAQARGENPLRSIIFQAIGAASACWEDLDKAGIFMDREAKQVGNALMDYLAEEMKPATGHDSARVYLDSAGEWRYTVRAGNNRVIGAAEEGFASKSNALRALRRRHPGLDYIVEETGA